MRLLEVTMFFKTLYIITLLKAIITFECSYSYPQIKMLLGTVHGRYKTSANGRMYESYESVPYALPPIGEHRFEPPRPIARWSKEVNGTVPSNPCMQYNSFADVTFGNEDCLYLNIYKPIQQMVSLLPIIIGIHGGEFQFGRGAELGPKYIMDKDIIFITINYRLGPLGFLSTGDSVISGNMGLKDQSLALQWVHENSRFFGGDVNRITLVGVSAGAASVQYHYLSTMSRGLFQNGISISGTVLAPWAFSRNPLKVLRTLLQNTTCSDENTIQIAECVKKIPAYELYNATRNSSAKYKFLPVAENTQDKFFIERDPREILNSGNIYDVPWITGVVSEEGLASIAGMVAKGKLAKYVNNHWNEMIPYMLYTNEFTSHNLSVETMDSIKKYYFANNTFKGDSKDIKTLAHLIGDSTYLIVGERAARLQATANKSPVWFYYYSYRAVESISNILTNSMENLGVCHGDDAFSVFQLDGYNPRRADQDKAMSTKWLNFWYSIASQKLVSSSEILISWPKVNSTSEKFSYLNISGPNELRVRNETNFGNKVFWTNIGL